MMWVNIGFKVDKNIYIDRMMLIRELGSFFKEDYMGSYSEIELEGRMYMVTSRYKEFLKMNYGPDYMTPPPIEQRKPEHFFI